MTRAVPRTLLRARGLRVLGLVAAFLLGCGAGDLAESASEGERLGVRDGPTWGAHLVDARGRSLYVFTADEGIEGSACTRACAEVWPPLVVRDAPQVTGSGLDAERIGIIRRGDGARQVTYAGRPLYRHREDRAPGDARGQSLQGFAGEWYLLAPTGDVIEPEAASTSESIEPERNPEPRPVLRAERIARVAMPLTGR